MILYTYKRLYEEVIGFISWYKQLCVVTCNILSCSCPILVLMFHAKFSTNLFPNLIMLKLTNARHGQ